MSNKNLLHIGKETLSSKPASKETFKGMHLAMLHQASLQKLDEHLLYILFELNDFILCELKERSVEMTSLELPRKDEEVLWLCTQFQYRAYAAERKPWRPKRTTSAKMFPG